MWSSTKKKQKKKGYEIISAAASYPGRPMFDSAESVNVSCVSVKCNQQKKKEEEGGTCDSPGPGNS